MVYQRRRLDNVDVTEWGKLFERFIDRAIGHLSTHLTHDP